MDTTDDRNACSRASVELHLRCSRRGHCYSALVSRKWKKESIVYGAMCTVSSGISAGCVSLHDSRQRVAGVIVTGMWIR